MHWCQASLPIWEGDRWQILGAQAAGQPAQQGQDTQLISMAHGAHVCCGEGGRPRFPWSSNPSAWARAAGHSHVGAYRWALEGGCSRAAQSFGQAKAQFVYFWVRVKQLALLRTVKWVTKRGHSSSFYSPLSISILSRARSSAEHPTCRGAPQPVSHSY